MKLCNHIVRVIISFSCAVCFIACSTTKHVPQGEYLLDKVAIVVKPDSISGNSVNISSAELHNYLRQHPNHKVLGFLKLQLATYNLSGRDSLKRVNRFLRKLGKPPVIYDSVLSRTSADQLRQTMINRGYMDARVDIVAGLNEKKRKADIKYIITPGQPHYIATVDYSIPDTAIARIIAGNMRRLPIKPGGLLDRRILEQERAQITTLLRNQGYYSFTKENITFSADTAEGAKDVNLTLLIKNKPLREADSLRFHKFRIANVIFVTDYNPGKDFGKRHFSAQDTVSYRGIRILYGDDHYLRPSILYDACSIRPGGLFCQRDIDLTYESLGRLSILRYVNIEMRPVDGDPGNLDAYIMLTRGKKQVVSLELEGTNSEGDLGFGTSLTYQHKNLFHGSELLNAKFRASYESLSGNFNGFINNRYVEYGTELGIVFPNFKAPFLSSRFKRKVKANTEFSMSFDYQERPEYTRIIAGAAWRYKWNNIGNTLRHRFDLIDINYVRLPQSTLNFIDEIAPSNPLLRYSYEDHFIMLIGYNYYRTNKRIANPKSKMFQQNVFTIRASVETSGNTLYAISSLSDAKRKGGAYKVFGIQYAQYAKADADYTYTHNFTPRTSMAAHIGMGIGVPYGNSSVIPFAKSFYAGGANGVRGWGVRTLGPGSYNSKNSVSDFINQCGDIRLFMSLEFRQKLFWVLEGAFFVDGGNIWTIRNYENQPGGVFKFNKFYKEIAAAYGIGLRADFSFFLLRLDMGVKAYNPAQEQEPWPLIHPRWNRDTTFHFSIGYPF